MGGRVCLPPAAASTFCGEPATAQPTGRLTSRLDRHKVGLRRLGGAGRTFYAFGVPGVRTFGRTLPAAGRRGPCERWGASVGVASFPDDGGEGRSLINVADRRMYEDKFQRRRAASEARPPEPLAAAR